MSKKLTVLGIAALFLLTSFAMFDADAANDNRDAPNIDGGVSIDSTKENEPLSGHNWKWENHILTLTGDVDYIRFMNDDIANSNDVIWSEGITIQIVGECIIDYLGYDNAIDIESFVPSVKITGDSLTITAGNSYYEDGIHYEGAGDLVIENLDCLKISGFGYDDQDAISSEYSQNFLIIRNCKNVIFEDADNQAYSCVYCSNGKIEISNTHIEVVDSPNIYEFSYADKGYYNMEEPNNAVFDESDDWGDGSQIHDIYFTEDFTGDWSYGTYVPIENKDFAPIAIGIFVALLAIVAVGAFCFSKK